MRVTFTYEPADFVRYSRSRIRRRFVRGAIVMAVLLFGVDALVLGLSSEALPILSVELLVGWLALTLMYLLFPRANRQQTYENALLQGPYSVEIDARAVGVHSHLYDARYQWQSIRTISDDNSNVYLVLPNLAAIIVPKRAFASAGEAERFLAVANSYWRGEPAPAQTAGPSSWPPPPGTP